MSSVKEYKTPKIIELFFYFN
ncbi:UNVERIFIED_CONTAM: hypothetical protein GTU68_045650 [Idotea baltica]|nr:hypothetical protein [Idotea baltica]